MSAMEDTTSDEYDFSAVKDSVSPEEWQQRVDLAAAYRLVAYYGWDDMVFTHISAKVPGEDTFLINPYGMLFEEITASSLVKINMAGEKIGDNPYPVNPAGFTIHSAVHEVRHDAECVMHVHTVDGTAVATTEGGLLPLNQTAMLIREDLAYHEYEGVALNHDERPRLQEDLGTKKGSMLLWNHGTLTLGSTIATAFTRMYFLERACSMQVATLSSGRPLHEAKPEVAQVVAGQGAGVELSAGFLVWPAMIRMLDRNEPDYQD
jgi:ribulose-5-phosphate 4-epimerase/fuculose-1-phosphate aldolase